MGILFHLQSYPRISQRIWEFYMRSVHPKRYAIRDSVILKNIDAQVSNLKNYRQIMKNGCWDFVPYCSIVYQHLDSVSVCVFFDIKHFLTSTLLFCRDFQCGILYVNGHTWILPVTGLPWQPTSSPWCCEQSSQIFPLANMVASTSIIILYKSIF